jgi:ribosomal-protein-serine acetyltransferase
MFELTVDNEITVRTLHPDDAGAFFQLLERNRPRLRPWIDPSSLPETAQATRIFTVECYFGSLDPLTAIDTPYIDEVRPYYAPSDPPMEMGIWFRGALVGEITLSTLEGSSTAAEFGYWIDADHEGKGLVTRCIRALMEHAVDHMAIERFVIGCALDNQRSRAVPERLGYHLRETIPNGEVVGEFTYDRVVYEIRSTEWRSRNQAAGQNL